MQLVDEILSWMIVEANSNERKMLIKRICDVLPEEELRKVSSIASKAKKRRKRKEAATKAVSSPEEEKYNGSAQQQCLSVPVISPQNGWYRRFKRRNVVALDVEKVEMITETAGKYEMKAGSVAVVDNEQNIIYRAKIYRKYDSYRVTQYSIQKNGFLKTTLQSPDCKPIEQIIEELHQILQSKLIVGIGLEGDFASLDLPVADYNVFDLQWHFYLTFISPKGRLIKEPLGLRSLCCKYFKIDMQPETITHDAYVDASWTMSLFIDVYTKIKPEPTEMHNPFGCNGDILHYKQLYN